MLLVVPTPQLVEPNRFLGVVSHDNETAVGLKFLDEGSGDDGLAQTTIPTDERALVTTKNCRQVSGVNVLPAVESLVTKVSNIESYLKLRREVMRTRITVIPLTNFDQLRVSDQRLRE